MALGCDGHNHVDRPFRDLPVPNLDVDGVHEENGIDAIDRPDGPFGHALHHLVGDREDRLLRDLGVVDLGQVRGRGDLPRG